MTWGEFSAAEKLTPFEKRFIGEVLNSIRAKDEAWGGQDSEIKTNEMLEVLRDVAYRIECAAIKKDDAKLMRQAEVVDATCNLILALRINQKQIVPILRRHKERIGAWRT